MLNTAGLSLEQAPPISIPFRFFITAPLFGVAAGVLLAVLSEEVLISRWHPATLALTHLISIGFLGMTMCGALMQMLPVLAGSPVPGVVLVGTLSHILLLSGTASLVYGFLSGDFLGMITALCLLGTGFLIVVIAVGIALSRVKVPNPTVTGMRWALVSLVITIVVGFLLVTGLFGVTRLHNLTLIADLHLGWGLLGWIGLLLIGVAFQVVPMFQVTPEYPKWMQKLMVPGLFFGILGWFLLELGGTKGYWSPVLPFGWFLLVITGFAGFALLTLNLQRLRKRRVPDTTLLFWQTGMTGIVCGYFIWLSGRYIPHWEDQPEYSLMLGVVLFLGGVYPLVNGMLYKIVPFLSWFHLQHRQLSLMALHVQLPHMKGFISDRLSRSQYYTYLMSLVLVLGAVLNPGWFAVAAGIAVAVSNLLLAYILLRAFLLYRRTAGLLEQALTH
ncbi:MAG: hypothetical protein GY703_06030 [Gammaproteobacteria bacterium]|nr:hypothetical protein [Gammaproteobacteria bacterium]